MVGWMDGWSNGLSVCLPSPRSQLFFFWGGGGGGGQRHYYLQDYPKYSQMQVRKGVSGKVTRGHLPGNAKVSGR